MPDLTKGNHTTLTLRRTTKKLLKNYRDTFRFRSFDKAIMELLENDMTLRKLGELVYKKELGEMNKND